MTGHRPDSRLGLGGPLALHDPDDPTSREFAEADGIPEAGLLRLFAEATGHDDTHCAALDGEDCKETP